MTSASELYQGVILDHNRSPRNYGRIEGGQEARGHNPLCGDEVRVSVEMDGDVVRDVRFEGQGCAISRASASLMTTAVKGRSRAEVEAMLGRFQALVTGRLAEGEQAALPPKLKVFSNVAQFPVRVKCASLAWHVLREALTAEKGER